MQLTERITINGRNIDRTKTVVSIIGAAGTVIDITPDVVGIDYTPTQEKEFGFNLGLYPTHFAAGSITIEGTLTLTDGGIAKLDDYAKTIGGLNLLDLGQTFDMDIQIEYVLNDGALEVDILHIAHFTDYPRGVANDTLINERDLSFISAQYLRE